MEPRGNPKLLERFAVARLQYTVNELRTQVDHDRNLTPPVRKVFHCVADESVLTVKIAGFKTWVSEGFITLAVPFCTLDALDDTKKGTDSKNINSRETIRYLERCQVKPIRGAKVLSAGEMFVSWAECEQFRLPEILVPSPSPMMEADGSGSGLGTMLPPVWIQKILNSMLYKIHNSGERRSASGDGAEDPVILVTNYEELRNWAAVFGIQAVDLVTIERMIDAEGWDFQNRKQRYEALMSPVSPTRAGRGGRSGSFGRGGGRGGRRNSRTSEQPIDPEFSRGNHSAASYTLRGPPPGGVARGCGRLWEP
ncbi:unnamed protein product [Tuber melanosporum]|jgi:hypothetical protein|uniref:(Perigord truffle) hypothetical protein n=1 Tax=Tuber melanosporum (strain Mel28) TaxID=656061 RepID=D5GCN9_TUBMM|nr:uncharacterized protein GSTUM_00000781001 [Tuber melanosporum]CAZ82282.1 unnamed protein product [Tuber melanosporum]